MNKLKVGDIVIVKGSGSTYNFTKDGSIGKIITFWSDGRSAEIEFTKLTGYGRTPVRYEINVLYLQLYERVKPVIKQYGICEFVTKYYK